MKHTPGMKVWKNELFEHLVIIFSFEAEFIDALSNTLFFLQSFCFYICGLYILQFIHYAF